MNLFSREVLLDRVDGGQETTILSFTGFLPSDENEMKGAIAFVFPIPNEGTASAMDRQAAKHVSSQD